MNSIDTHLPPSAYAPAAITAQVPAAPAPQPLMQAQPQPPSPQPAALFPSAQPVSVQSLQASRAGDTYAKASAYSIEKKREENSAEADLKSTGVKTEIQIEKGVGVVVQLVQSGTNKVVMQSPPQGVIDMVAQIEQTQDKEMKIDPGSPEPDASTPGVHIDKLA